MKKTWLVCILEFVLQFGMTQNADVHTGNSKKNFERPVLLSFIEQNMGHYMSLAQVWENQRPDEFQTTAEYLFIVTTDGVRWQEVFEGADSLLLSKVRSENQLSCFSRFYRENVLERRSRLLPFFWSVLQQEGKIFGNRHLANEVSVTNRRHISYPGYAEIFCGYADDERILFNAPKFNPNSTVLEYFNQIRSYRNRIAAFCSWNVFPYILNEKRAGFTVNAGFEPWTPKPGKALTLEHKQINQRLEVSPKPWKNHVRPDTLTWAFARHYILQHTPKVVYIGFGETDEYAHHGDYVGYLNAISRFDSLLAKIWDFIQQHKVYKGKTALLVTTDHGRGKHRWKSHHVLNPGSDEIWLAVASPDLAPGGEIQSPMQIRQEQFAATMAALIGMTYTCAEHPVAPRIETIFEERPASASIPASTPHFSIQSTNLNFKVRKE